MMKFMCDQCGLCCKNLSTSILYTDLNRGDGICKFFDEKTNLCSDYENRPLKCRIDEMYEVFYKDKLSLYDYYKLNYSGCENLKNKEKI